jgi:hypothetical protein
MARRTSPRINLSVLGDPKKRLRGYEVRSGALSHKVMRRRGESESALRERANAVADGIVGREIVVSLVELRGR